MSQDVSVLQQTKRNGRTESDGTVDLVDKLRIYEQFCSKNLSLDKKKELYDMLERTNNLGGSSK